jgi:hypothetical protein
MEDAAALLFNSGRSTWHKFDQVVNHIHLKLIPSRQEHCFRLSFACGLAFATRFFKILGGFSASCRVIQLGRTLTIVVRYSVVDAAVGAVLTV